MSQLSPIRAIVPMKGMNTVASPRVMSKEFAPELLNLWYDDGITLRKRLAQTLMSPIPANIFGTSYTEISEMRKFGIKKILAQTNAGFLFEINLLSAVAPFLPEDYYVTNATKANIVYAQKHSLITLGGKTVIGDGVGNAYIYDGVATVGGQKVWKPLLATQTPSVVLGNIFHVHRGRCYAAGDPASPMTVRYSDVALSAGLDYWSPTVVIGTAPVTDITGAIVASAGSKGGFIDIASDLSEADVITGLTTHRGYFVVLCKRHILFYNITDPNLTVGGLPDPNAVRLYKIVAGEGCISNKSIQGVGEDTIFLSPNGFKKLSVSMIQGDSQVNDLSQPINNIVKQALRTSTFKASQVSSTYNPKYGIYMCHVGSDTWCYQTQFEGWFKWIGMYPVLFTDSALDSYTAGVGFHKLDSSASADSAAPYTGGWTTYPFKSEGLERKPRWNRVEVLYEAPAASTDVLTVSVYPDLDTGQAVTYTNMLGKTTARLPDGRVERRFSIPLSFRSELLTVKIESSTGDVRMSIVEVYYNDGGLR